VDRVDDVLAEALPLDHVVARLGLVTWGVETQSEGCSQFAQLALEFFERVFFFGFDPELRF
jgi:hypothetical protein